jgi:hypothetical protein
MTTPSISRCQGDHGSVVLEFALILPFLATMISGILELGLLFRQQTILTGVVQGAGRTGSHVGKGRNADQLTLASINSQLGNLPNTQLVKVVIYKASVADGTLPSGCTISPSSNGTPSLGVGVNGSCNIYSPKQVELSTTATLFGGTPSTTCVGSSSTSIDHFWCPEDRIDSLSSNPDHFGVWVTANYSYVTKLFGAGPKAVNEHAVYRVEVLS